MFSSQLQQWLVATLAAHGSAAAWAAGDAAAGSQGGLSPPDAPQAAVGRKQRAALGEALREMLVQLCLVERSPRRAAGEGGEVAEVGLHGFMAVRSHTSWHACMHSWQKKTCSQAY